jgi:hypothetical protein
VFIVREYKEKGNESFGFGRKEEHRVAYCQFL